MNMDVNKNLQCVIPRTEPHFFTAFYAPGYRSSPPPALTSSIYFLLDLSQRLNREMSFLITWWVCVYVRFYVAQEALTGRSLWLERIARDNGWTVFPKCPVTSQAMWCFEKFAQQTIGILQLKINQCSGGIWVGRKGDDWWIWRRMSTLSKSIKTIDAHIPMMLTELCLTSEE